jgi:hypothetical protein
LASLLKVYQSDKPLLPFLEEDVLKLIKQCLEQFCDLKAEVLANIFTVEIILRLWKLF